LSLVGLSFCFGSGFYGWRYWNLTRERRAVNSAVVITNSSDLMVKEGEYVVFEGRIKTVNPHPSTYMLNNEGKPVNTAIYRMEEHKWLEVFEEPQGAKFSLFRKKIWVPKDQIIKRSEEIRDFSVTSKKKGTIIPEKIGKLHLSPDFPLFKMNNVYRPPENLATKGMMLAEVYESGFHSRELYLEDNCKVTVIGKLQKTSKGVTIVPDTDKPYIMTYLSLKEVKDKLKFKGLPELTLSVAIFIVGLGFFAAGSQQRRSQQQQQQNNPY